MKANLGHKGFRIYILLCKSSESDYFMPVKYNQVPSRRFEGNFGRVTVANSRKE